LATFTSTQLHKLDFFLRAALKYQIGPFLSNNGKQYEFAIPGRFSEPFTHNVLLNDTSVGCSASSPPSVTGSVLLIVFCFLLLGLLDLQPGLIFIITQEIGSLCTGEL